MSGAGRTHWSAGQDHGGLAGVRLRPAALQAAVTQSLGDVETLHDVLVLEEDAQLSAVRREGEPPRLPGRR